MIVILYLQAHIEQVNNKTILFNNNYIELVSGIIDTCFRINNYRILLNEIINMNDSDHLSISLWFKYNNSSGCLVSCFNTRIGFNNLSGDIIKINLESGKIKFTWYKEHIYVESSVLDNNWHHLVLHL